jgi:hypothetical protein
VAIYCASRRRYLGSITARSGASSAYVAANGFHLGSVYTDESLIYAVTVRPTGSVGPNATYQLDVAFNVSQRGQVQVIRTAGGGNGTRTASATNFTAVVRGMWRVGYKASGQCSVHATVGPAARAGP